MDSVIMSCRRSVLVVGLVALMSSTSAARAQSPALASRDTTSPPYTELFYKNGDLHLEAYLYKPAGPEGTRFPLVIYNHGSRVGFDRQERRFPWIAKLLTAQGYAVLVPERRGYGKSEGQVFRDEVGFDVGEKLVARMQAESGDVLAALPAMRNYPWVDTTRVAMVGWSFGGIVSVFAAGRANAPKLFAVVNQAGAALTWPKSPAVQVALPDAAKNIRVPLLCMVAENDATTESVTKVCAAAKARGTVTATIIYPAFTPAQDPGPMVAPGHMIFSAEGLPKWEKDVLDFLARYRPR